MRGVRKRILAVGMVIWISIYLSGCAGTELEERIFPMMSAIGYEVDNDTISYIVGFPIKEEKNTVDILMEIYETTQVKSKSFSESKEKYENRFNKHMDYNHLKVIVFEEELLQEERAYYEVIEQIAKEEEFPRNAYICVVDDIDDLMELQENITSDLGTFLEEYLDKIKSDVKIVTLGDLIDEKENKLLEVVIPVLEVDEYFVEWDRNFILSE